MSSRRWMPAYVEDYDETTGTVGRDSRQVASTKKSKAHDRLQARRNGKGTRKVASPKKSKGHRDSREPRISFSGPQYPGESSSRDAPAVEEEKVVGLVERREAFGLDDPWGPGVMPESVIKKFNRGPGASLPVGGSGGVSSRASKNMVSQQQVTSGPNTRKNSIVASPFSSAAPKTQATTPTSNPDRSINESQYSPSVTGSGGAEVHTTPDTTSGFGSRFAASVSRLFRPDSSSLPNPSPSPAENKRASPEEKIRQQDEEIRRRAPIPLRPRQYNPSNITWGPTTVLDGVKKTVVPTQLQPTVIWGPTTILGRTKSPPIVARGTRTSPSQDLDSDASSTQSTDDYAQQITSRNWGIKSNQRRNRRFPTSGSATSRPQSEPTPLEEFESRRQTSRGTRVSHGTNIDDNFPDGYPKVAVFLKSSDSELLKDAETYEQQPRSDEPKREAEFLSDEQIQQQEDEIRGPLVVPTVSHTQTWAGFDVQGYEPGSRSMENAEFDWGNLGLQFRNSEEDVLTRESFAREDAWASRPPAKVLINHLDDFFPNLDLDQPVLEASSGNSPPVSPIAESNENLEQLAAAQAGMSITPDGITYSTTLNSEAGDPDDDDAVLHQKASAPSLETSFLDTEEDMPKRPETGRGNRWLTGLKDLDAQEEEYFNTSDDELDILPVEPLGYEFGTSPRRFPRRNRNVGHELAASALNLNAPGADNVMESPQMSTPQPTNDEKMGESAAAIATNKIGDRSKLAQYIRENDFQGLFAPSYLPLLERPSRNERRSSTTEDERETGHLFDGKFSEPAGNLF